MKSTNYIVIQGWMCNELGLKGNELLIYALIYGFSQDGESLFMGSRNYIAETFNISLPTVDKALNSLKDKNLIRCYTDNKTYWHYSTCKETLQVDVKKLYEGSKETLLNNTINNTNNKKSNSKELLQNSEFQFGKSKPKKDNLFTKCVAIIDSYDFSSYPEIRALLIQYLNYRLQIKDKPLYANMWKGMLNKLCNICDDDTELYKAVIQQSIERGYLAFYPISSYSRNTNIRESIEQLPPSEAMTEDDYRELDRLTEERRKRGLRTEF